MNVPQSVMNLFKEAFTRSSYGSLLAQQTQPDRYIIEIGE
jgi:hypothetical protein